MATVTVRNLDDSVTAALKALGQAHGRSMEAEVRAILTTAVTKVSSEVGLATRIREAFAPFDITDEFDLARNRDDTRPVTFDE